MGCQLPKPRGSDDAPGKIFSTLRRAQVETPTGHAYTYHFLDFLLGAEEVTVSSLLSLSSVRELPLQVCEFYQKGFVLAAVHPFVHGGGPDAAALQKRLHRAVLVRESRSVSEGGAPDWAEPHLTADVCHAGPRDPAPDVVQAYAKKVQDWSERGQVFVGFLRQHQLSSLHSSPCPAHHTINRSLDPCWTHHHNPFTHSRSLRAEREEQPGRTHEQPSQTQTRVQVFALYSHAMSVCPSPEVFSVVIPLAVRREAGTISSLECHWLDHMSQHFRNGAQLLDGFLHLDEENESASVVESVFLFRRSCGDPAYDAIVVEQWTAINGVAVKSDYIPLLVSLAPHGWRLVCVLPTPLLRATSDGCLATKQILFLQRPVMLRRRRDVTKRCCDRGQNHRNLSSKRDALPLATIEGEMERMGRETRLETRAVTCVACL